jgi:hypothetical protein
MLAPMGPSTAEILLNPAATTVELERGRFARYVGSGRWESHFKSRRGVDTPDGPLLTADVLSRFPPDSYGHERVLLIIAAVDG